MRINIPTMTVAVVMIGGLVALALLGTPGVGVAAAGVLTTIAGAALPRLLGKPVEDDEDDE